ncbi:MAG: hypothetical protein MUC85_05380 [Anaerolineales bacterium]|jgi:hypothetical protein|nr:hypothetical protein [Anaerolineales bacterium]
MNRNSLVKLSQHYKASKPMGMMMLLWLIMFALPSLACESARENWYPAAATEIIAEEVTVREVYVLLDEAGNVVDFGGPYTYGSTAELRYMLTFYDAGARIEYKDIATIYKVYTPLRITAINEKVEETMDADQKAAAYARTSFPSTKIQETTLKFSGGPSGAFTGTNPETGKPISGYLEYHKDTKEWHVIFTEGIKQDYLILNEVDPFESWP